MRFHSVLARSGRKVLLMVNGSGGTPLVELYGMVHAAHKVLAGAGIKVVRQLTGSYVTSLEMPGCSVSALDGVHLALRDAPVPTAASLRPVRNSFVARHAGGIGFDQSHRAFHFSIRE